MIPSAVVVAIGENAGSMNESMSKSASEVLDWNIDQFQVRNSGKFTLSKRSRLWYTNLASVANEPEFNPEAIIDKGWWPKGKINKQELIVTWNSEEIESQNVRNYLSDNTSVSSHEPDKLTPDNGKIRWRVTLNNAFNDERIKLFQKAINKDLSYKIRVFYGRYPRNSMLPLMTVTRDYLNKGVCIISTASYKPRHMLHKCDEDYEALDPNFEEIDNLFPGIRQKL
eukprot:12149706-Heterocapsa_arctica.AAC.1